MQENQIFRQCTGIFKCDKSILFNAKKQDKVAVSVIQQDKNALLFLLTNLLYL